MFDEISIDSTISNQSNEQKISCFFLDNEDYQAISTYEDHELVINNIISYVNLGKNLNLKNINLKIKNSELNNNKLTLISKFNNSKKTAIIFSSGKMILSGAKTEKESKASLIMFAKLINKAWGNVELKDYKIQNIIASYDIRFKLSLNILYDLINESINNKNKLNLNIYDYCKMENSLFKGIIYYLDEEKITIIIFESGKVSISGAKNIIDIENTFKNIYPFLIESKKIID